MARGTLKLQSAGMDISGRVRTSNVLELDLYAPANSYSLTKFGQES